MRAEALGISKILPTKLLSLKGGRTTLFAVCLGVLLSFFLNPSPSLGWAQSQSQLPAAVRNVGIDQRLNEQVPPDIEFHDEDGRTVRLAQYFGKDPLILSLVYHECPMLCSELLEGLLRAVRVLSLDIGKDFQILTVSFNPREGPSLAKSVKDTYVRRYKRTNAGAGWHFLTGDQASIERLTRAVGFRYSYDPEKNLYAHAGGIMVLTPEGRISRYFYGIDFAPRDLRLGLIEASQNRIGSIVDQVLLFCYHYDPVTGKYGFVILTSLRILGVLFVLGLVGYVVMMVRRERTLPTRSDTKHPTGKHIEAR